jgi:hypothetical protein
VRWKSKLRAKESVPEDQVEIIHEGEKEVGS